MSEHEQEERELVTGMERALAVAIATSASMLESVARWQEKRSQAAERAALARAAGPGDAQQQHDVQRRIRADLARGQNDPQFWTDASPGDLADRMRHVYGVDPAKVGNRDDDRAWAHNAKAADLVEVYRAADKWKDESSAAAGLRDNLKEYIAEFGLDADHLMSQPRGTAAQLLLEAQAKVALGAADPSAAFVAGQQVETLLSQAHDADVRAHDAGEKAADIAAKPAPWDRPDAARTAEPAAQQPQPRREAWITPAAGEGKAVRLAETGTRAGDAAAVAARDHPSNPRAAVQSARAGRAKARPARATTQGRDRSRGL